CSGGVTRLPAQPCEAASGGQRVGVVRAEHPYHVGQQFLCRGCCSGGVTRLPAQPCEAASGGQRVGVVRAECSGGAGGQGGEVGGGVGEQAGLAEAVAVPEQDRVSGGLPQRCRVAVGQDGGVRTEHLTEGGFGFDRGPCVEQGVGGCADRAGCGGLVEGVGGGALGESVHADAA